MWRSTVDFAKLKICRVLLLYLLKHKFYLSRNWIFLTVYRIQKLKIKACFSQNSIAKTCFFLSQAKKVSNEVINRSFENFIPGKQVNTTKEYIWQTNLKFNVQNMNLHKQVALHLIVLKVLSIIFFILLHSFSCNSIPFSSHGIIGCS